MGFGVDYNKAPQSTVEPGWYEVVINGAGEDVSKSGTLFINIPAVIRNDVEQPYQNAFVWYKINRRSEPTADDLACDGYSSKQIQGLSKAVELPNGKSYNSLAEWCKELDGKPMLLEVYQEGYQGKMYTKTRFPGITKYSPCNHVYRNTDGLTNTYSDPLAKPLPF